MTAINFGAEPVEETVRLAGVASGQALNMFSNLVEGAVDNDGGLRIRLDGYSGKSYLIAPETIS